MIIIVSPAKKLNEERARGHAQTVPRFLDEAAELAAVAREWSEDEIAKLMGISATLAKLNKERFQAWNGDGTCAAGLMFDGDVYKELEPATFDDVTKDAAQRRLRILSGLYGLLRPTDAIEAYRLEMGRKTPGHPAGTLYGFWGDKIAAAIVEEAREQGVDSVLNLASEEYAKAVPPKALSDLTLISPRFEEERGGSRKVIGIAAKRARGAMARWVLENGITEADDLKGFTVGGYAFDADVSQPQRPIFVRG